MSRFASASLISPIEFAAGNAYSRSKTGLEPKEGDEDLIDYYYLVLNPNCNTARDLRGSDGKRFLSEVLPRLKAQGSRLTCPSCSSQQRDLVVAALCSYLQHCCCATSCACCLRGRRGF